MLVNAIGADHLCDGGSVGEELGMKVSMGKALRDREKMGREERILSYVMYN